MNDLTSSKSIISTKLLPTEIWNEIFHYLNGEELLVMECVSKAFINLAEIGGHWKRIAINKRVKIDFYSRKSIRNQIIEHIKDKIHVFAPLAKANYLYHEHMSKYEAVKMVEKISYKSILEWVKSFYGNDLFEIEKKVMNDSRNFLEELPKNCQFFLDSLLLNHLTNLNSLKLLIAVGAYPSSQVMSEIKNSPQETLDYLNKIRLKTAFIDAEKRYSNHRNKEEILTALKELFKKFHKGTFFITGINMTWTREDLEIYMEVRSFISYLCMNQKDWKEKLV